MALLVFIVFYIYYNVNSVLSLSVNENSLLYVEVRKSYVPKFMPYDNATSIMYEDNDTIYLKCRRRVNYGSLLYWKDNFGYRSKSKSVIKSRTNSIELELRPDVDEANYLTITCALEGSPVSHVIYFKHNDALNNRGTAKSYKTVRYLLKGAPLRTSEDCKGIVRYPNSTLFKAEPNTTIIEHFTSKYNGIVIFCVSFKLNNVINNSQKWERLLEKVLVQYLSNQTSFEPGESDNNKTVLHSNKTAVGAKTLMTGSSLKIVIPVVSVMVLIIVLLTYIRWKRKTVSSELRVVYSKLALQRCDKPPPQAENTPYAEIIGVMAPVNRGISANETEHLYATINN